MPVRSVGDLKLCKKYREIQTVHFSVRLTESKHTQKWAQFQDVRDVGQCDSHDSRWQVMAKYVYIAILSNSGANKSGLCIARNIVNKHAR